MNSFKKSLYTALPFLPLVAALCFFIYAGTTWILPIAKSVHQKNIALLRLYKSNGTVVRLKQNASQHLKEISQLDSIIVAYDTKQSITSAAMISKIYVIADSSQLTTNKVEVGEATVIGNRTEIQVIYRGTGGFSGFGQFCERIENEDIPLRIRQITAKRVSDQIADYMIDFVIMEEIQL